MEKSTLSFFLEGSSGHAGHGGLALNRQNPLELGGGGWRGSGAERALTPLGFPEHHGRGAVRTRASPNSSPLAMQPVSQVLQKNHRTVHPLHSWRSSASLRVVQPSDRCCIMACKLSCSPSLSLKCDWMEPTLLKSRISPDSKCRWPRLQADSTFFPRTQEGPHINPELNEIGLPSASR